MKILLILSAVFLLNCSVSFQVCSKKIHHIQVIKLPNDIRFTMSLNTEELFDNSGNEFKEISTINTCDKLRFRYGKLLKNMDHIFIRSKVIITYANGKTKKIFFDEFGRIMSDHRIYSGSLELMKFFRGEGTTLNPCR